MSEIFMQEKPLTPLMQQYFALKAAHPDTILLFQVGDFYELFFEDAKTAASILGIALTQRGSHAGEPIPLCGVPVHVRDHYLTKLVKAGFKVALCDQLDEPRPGKLVERGITQVLTPGTLTDAKLLDEKSASYLAVFHETESSWTLMCAELLTGQLFVIPFQDKAMSSLEAELMRWMPDEIVLHKNSSHSLVSFLQRQGFMLSFQGEPSAQDSADAHVWITKRMQEPTTSESFHGGVALLYTYLKRTQEHALCVLKQVVTHRPEEYLLIDAATQRNLELVKNCQDGSAKHTLFEVLDRAVTPMGSRMLKKWILRPLYNKKSIEERHDAVEVLVDDHALKTELRVALKSLGDLERIVGRIALRRAHLHDYQALYRALIVLPQLKNLMVTAASHGSTRVWRSLEMQLGDYSEVTSLLARSINDDTSSEWFIKKGYHAELDRLRLLLEEGAFAVATFEQREQEKTGIGSLKVKFNQVHGYGIEVTKPNLHLVPTNYLRIQMLANRERFTTQELKDLEYDLKRARSDSIQVEKELYEVLKQEIERYLPVLKKCAYALAYADTIGTLAEVAYAQHYVRPRMLIEQEIRIQEGRHPVVETRLKERFIPNNVSLTHDQRLWIITGPNMGGKSTFLRQVALISIMAQTGSFVPAAQAELAMVDRVFTRIGASDNVAEGKSTFLVEMEETALICAQATKKSLVILDEVGRGTSTFDGLAIAQAVVEYLYTSLQTRCLFATHYHELTTLCKEMPGIKSYYAASMKVDRTMVLLHKILPGVADGSFGLEVAALARVPDEVVARAREIVGFLTLAEQAKVSPDSDLSLIMDFKALQLRNQQLEAYIALLAQEHEKGQYRASKLAELDYDNLTPKQALDILWQLR
jgi:DNA mismatch repair protein MutS